MSLAGGLDWALGESRAATLLRRSLTIPAYSAAFLLLFVAAPLLIAVLALFDAWRGRRFAATRAYSFLVAYLGCELIGVLAAAAIWLRFAFVSPNDPRYLAANFRLQCWWCGVLVGAGTRLFALRFAIEGEEHCRRGPILLYLRHTSLADTPLACQLISRPYGIVLRYVLKRRLLFDPCLDIVGNRLRNRFSRHGSGDSAAEVNAVAALAEGLGSHDGVLIYPEGTRFSAQKRAAVLAAFERKGDARRLVRAAALHHVLLPRSGGPVALLERNQWTSRADIIFCAHTGLEGSADFRDLWNGALINRTVRVRFWRVSCDELPQGTEALEDWLHLQWLSVEQAASEWAGLAAGNNDEVI